MNLYRAPLRIGFTGVATDIPDRIGDHVGFSVCSTIDKYAYVSIETRNTEPSSIDPPFDLFDPLLSKLENRPNTQIKWRCDVSLGTGLGASSSLLVALAKHFSRDPAHLANRVEIERGAGYQDSAMAFYPGCHVLKFRHDGFSIEETLPLPNANHFMLIYSGIQHDTQKQYAVRDAYPTKHIEDNRKRVIMFKDALNNEDYPLVGKVLNQTYRVKCENPTYGIPNMQSFMCDVLHNGAYGGKICGSGGGGHYLLAIDPSKRERLTEISKEYNYEPVSFAFTGVI